MTKLSLTNSLTRSKGAFTPINPEMVRMYVCGPTVYDRAHIGNFRPVVVFDTLYRVMRHLYGKDHVTYVRNITDVEDKINARAAERYPDLSPEEGIKKLTEETTEWFHEDMRALGVDYSDKAKHPNFHEPRATQYIAEMIEMNASLIEKGHAYEAEGHVLFAVDSFDEYGALSGRSTDDMIAGARVEIAPYKKNPMDFVLWKPSSDDQPGWDSPWGRGRPGWHIECSAMSRSILGPDFDIHGGGADLTFPHHENEIAQSRCACTGSGFAHTWLHNGMIKVGGRKMSKSLGNFITLHDLAEQVPGEVIRLCLLSSHYRQELDWTDKLHTDMEKTLRKWRALTDGVDAGEPDQGVIDALADDLNTPKAIAELHRVANAGDAATLKASAALMGILGDDIGDWAKAPEAGDASTLIEGLLVARADARKAKDFARADAIRDAFAAAGVLVKDTPEGAVWELAPNFDATKLEGL